MWRVAAEVTAANLAAALCAGVVGAVVDVVHGDAHVAYDLVAATFALGLLPLVYVLPVFLGAVAAARRTANPAGTLRLLLLGSAPLVWLPLSFALPQAVVLAYLGVLYGVAYVRLRRLAR
jgi:hypothetical protein